MAEKVIMQSIQNKRERAFYAKLYNEDVSFNSVRQKNGRYDFTHNFENIVYNELVFMGYVVSFFNRSGREIDFLAKKDGKEYLVQAAYSIAEAICRHFVFFCRKMIVVVKYYYTE